MKTLHHNGLSSISMSTERNDDPSGSSIGRIEVIIKVQTSVLALGNVPIFIKDKCEMAGNSALMD
jgi:hypothetical protein